MSNTWERKRRFVGGLFASVGKVAGVGLVYPTSGYL